MEKNYINSFGIMPMKTRFYLVFIGIISLANCFKLNIEHLKQIKTTDLELTVPIYGLIIKDRT